MVEIQETDTLFSDSPDAGHPDCKCSRCSELISHKQIPLRCWPTDDDGNVLNYEYRFCNKCAGITQISEDDDY